MGFETPGRVSNWIYFLGFFGPVFSLVSSAVLASSQKPQKIPYPLLVFLGWFIYNIGRILISMFEDYYLICETVASYVAYEATRTISYVGLLYSSMRMCYRLQTGHDDYERRSWYSYLNSRILIPKKHRIVANLVCKGGPFLLGFLFFVDYLFPFGNGIGYSECSIGTSDIRYGIFQYWKVLLEVAGVTLYSFGPPRTRFSFSVRYVLFIFLLVSSIASLVVLSIVQELRATNSYSMTIPRVLDVSIARIIVEFVHVFVVVSFGLLEPLRVGWPTRKSL